MIPRFKIMIKTIEINELSFNVAMTSAENQRSAMTIISRLVMAHSVALAKTGEKINADFILGVLMTLQEKDLIKLHELLLKQCFISGEDRSVDMKFFQGKMISYYKLLAETICFNLSDFFFWLDAEREQEPKTESEAQAQ